MDFALIAQAATLEARVPFLHFFDGFRTSHEVTKIELLADEDIRAHDRRRPGRARTAPGRLTPDRPVMRGTAQNPDVFFQAREAANPFYLRLPDDRSGGDGPVCAPHRPAVPALRLRGAPDAERVIVLMGSGAETAQETVEHLKARGEKVGRH